MNTIATVLQWTLIAIIIGLLLRYSSGVANIISSFGGFWTSESKILASQ